MRIVSLLPSATEICFALGAGSEVVGVTFECDFPAEARSRSVVSSTALPDGLDPAGIDAAVRTLIASGADLYHLDRDALGRIDPDVVITQDLCAVCALDSDDVTEALAYLGCTAEVVTTDPHDLAEVWASVELIGKALGRSAEASYLVSSLTERLSAVQSSVYGARPVRTMVLEWTDPPYAPGHWIPQMVEMAGGISVLGSTGSRSFPTNWAAIAAAEPEVIVSAPCGFDLDAAAALTSTLTDLPSGVPVWAVDANAAFARPGPRLVDGVEALAAILHTGQVNPHYARHVR